MPLTTHTPDTTPAGWAGWTTTALNDGPLIRDEVMLDTASSSTATATWSAAITTLTMGFSVAFDYRVIGTFVSLTLDVLGSGGTSDKASLKLTSTNIELYDSTTLLATVPWTPRMQGRVVYHFSDAYTFVDINNTTLLVTSGLPYATFSEHIVGLRFADLAQTTYLDKACLYHDARETPASAVYGYSYSSP